MHKRTKILKLTLNYSEFKLTIFGNHKKENKQARIVSNATVKYKVATNCTFWKTKTINVYKPKELKKVKLNLQSNVTIKTNVTKIPHTLFPITTAFVKLPGNIAVNP